MLFILCWLRRPDSNRRPLGYEPNELPTAPLRDVKYCLFLNCDAKVRFFLITTKHFYSFFCTGFSTCYDTRLKYKSLHLQKSSKGTPIFQPRLRTGHSAAQTTRMQADKSHVFPGFKNPSPSKVTFHRKFVNKKSSHPRRHPSRKKHPDQKPGD